MKRIFLFIGLLLTFSNLTAQKKVTKTISSSKIDDVFIHLKFAQNIVIKNWNKSVISVEATVNINQNKDNNVFSLESDKDGKSLTVTATYGDYFKRNKSVINRMTIYNYNNTVLVNYVIYVPKNMMLKVKSISGSVVADNYNGVLTLNLISGNITIKKHSKKMNLKTISGDIDVYISDATFNAKTISGNVYSDLEIDFNKGRKKNFGRKIYGTVKKGTASLKLNTISGDIFLRKI